MTAPQQVIKLVERFQRNLDEYKRPDNRGTSVRVAEWQFVG
jgi:hypothetical protein